METGNIYAKIMNEFNFNKPIDVIDLENYKNAYLNGLNYDNFIAIKKLYIKCLFKFTSLVNQIRLSVFALYIQELINNNINLKTLQDADLEILLKCLKNTNNDISKATCDFLKVKKLKYISNAIFSGIKQTKTPQNRIYL